MNWRSWDDLDEWEGLESWLNTLIAVEVRISGVLGIGRGDVREGTGWGRSDWGSVRVVKSVGRDWEE